MQHRQAEHGVELRQAANCVRRHEGPRYRCARHAVVQSRKLADNADVGRLDTDGKQVEIGGGASDEPALGAADIEQVFHAVVAQHLRDPPAIARLCL